LAVKSTSASPVSSSSEENLPLSISNKPTNIGGGIADLLDEISYEIKIEGASDLSLQDGGSAYKIDFNLSSKFDHATNKADSTNLYDGVSDYS
jgi:hypothetical protein